MHGWMPDGPCEQVWDLREGQLFYTLYGHEGAIAGVAFAPAGDFFASAGADEQVGPTMLHLLLHPSCMLHFQGCTLTIRDELRAHGAACTFAVSQTWESGSVECLMVAQLDWFTVEKPCKGLCRPNAGCGCRLRADLVR